MRDRRVVRPLPGGYMPREPRGRQKRRSVNVRVSISPRRIRTFIIIAVIAIALGWLWSRFSLQKVTVNGNRAVSSADISKLVNQELKAPWQRNLLAINAEGLAATLSKADTRIASADISRDWPHGLRVVVTEREYSLLWKTSDQTFILDNNGAVVTAAGSGTGKLPMVIDSTNLPVKVGDRVVPPRFVGFAKDVFALLPKRTAVKISEMSVPDTTSEVYVKTDKGYTIKFDTTREASGEVDDLVAVLAQLKLLGKTPAEYIDLRIEHKAYYR